MRGIARRSIIAELILDFRHGKNRGNAWHAELAKGGAELHGGPDASQRSSRVAGDRRGSPEPLLKEMIQEVFQDRRNTMIVLSTDDQKAVGGAANAG